MGTGIAKRGPSLSIWHRSNDLAYLLLALILRRQTLCLAGNTTLARLAESPLLPRVRKIGILLRHSLRRGSHLARHVLGHGFEVGSAVGC